MSHHSLDLLEEWVEGLRKNPLLKKYNEKLPLHQGTPIKFNEMSVKLDELKKFDIKYNPSLQKIEEIVACYSLGEVGNGGVPILDVINSVGVNFYELDFKTPAAALKQIHDSIRMGDTMAGPMGREILFSPETRYLTEIGGETGELYNLLKKSADILEAKVRHNLTQEQTGEIVFSYGLKTLLNAGLSSERSLRMLLKLSERNSVGPSPELINIMIELYNNNSTRDLNIENLASDIEKKYFS